MHIYVIAFQRTHSLHRLLVSLVNAEYPNPTNLTISISEGYNPEIVDLLQEFNWDYGLFDISFIPKMTIYEQYRYIMKESTGGIIILEDDLVVSPVFMYFAEIATQFDDIAGVSLNALNFNGYNKFPFYPIRDKGDNYYMQLAFYHGMAFSRKMISKFLKYVEKPLNENDLLHEKMIELANIDDEWFPLMTKYLIDTDQYFLFPYVSLTSNFGEIGKHFTHSTTFFQNNMEYKKKEYRIVQLKDAISIYDSFQELLPLVFERLGVSRLNEYVNDLLVDLNGSKSERIMKLSKKKYVLTIRQGQQIINWNAVMRPLFQNILYNIDGKGIILSHTESLNFTKSEDKRISSFLYNLHNMESFQLSIYNIVKQKFKSIVRGKNKFV